MKATTTPHATPATQGASVTAGHKSAALRILTEAYDLIQMGNYHQSAPKLVEAARRLDMASEVPADCSEFLSQVRLGITHSMFVAKAMQALRDGLEEVASEAEMECKCRCTKEYIERRLHAPACPIVFATIARAAIVKAIV